MTISLIAVASALVSHICQILVAESHFEDSNLITQRHRQRRCYNLKKTHVLCMLCFIYFLLSFFFVWKRIQDHTLLFFPSSVCHWELCRKHIRTTSLERKEKKISVNKYLLSVCDWSSIKCETKCGHVFVFQIFCDSNQWTETTHSPKQQSQFVCFPRVLFAKISQDWGLIFWKVVPNAGEEVGHILKIVHSTCFIFSFF